MCCCQIKCAAVKLNLSEKHNPSIIAADEIEEDSEKAFINELRTYLKLEDFLIAQRFGDISYLKPKASEFDDWSLNDEKSIEFES